jgi:hypothetical protein
MTDLVRMEQAYQPNRKMMYLGERAFPLHIRNVGLLPVRLRSAWLRLHGMPGWSGQSALLTCRQPLNVVLVPGELHSVEVAVVPPLFASNDSNAMDAGVEFDIIHVDRVETGGRKVQKAFDWIDVRELPALATGEVFVSFVDPENESLAVLACVMLRRAGLRPYLAREESRPGCDYWTEKIYPAIERSSGVFVIWTEDTVRRSEAVLREITHAQAVGVPVGLFLARGMSAPAQFPADRREHVPFDLRSPHEAFGHAIATGRRRWEVSGRFF